MDFTSAAIHDFRTLKGLHFPAGSFIAMNRAYIDYAEMERLTREKVCYVAKMKKNLTFNAKRCRLQEDG